MHNSSEFQFVAIDQIHESVINPRLTFEQNKLEELAASIKQHGVIQPITLRPTQDGFEIVAGARRFRAAQLAELFSIPARIVVIDDAHALEWMLVENSQRVDVHPYEEAEGFQRLLDMPGYDVAALAAKSGKSTSHIYARLALLQLVPEVATAYVEDRITTSHANLLARLPQEHQQTALEHCWRKDWNDDEPHLLPAKHLSAWIEANLYLALAEAPFDREDATLSAEAGACVTCPKRTGYNTSLFAEVQGDQCLDGQCFQNKVALHIDRVLADNPQLVQIETSWRPPKEQRLGALTRNAFEVLEEAPNLDAEPSCASTKTALVVFGREIGKTVSICTDDECPVHNAAVAARLAQEQAENPAPVMEPAPEKETKKQAQAREAENERRRQEWEAERERKAAERKAEFERQQKEYEAEQKRREKIHKERLATLERIIEQAPAAFAANQLRFLLTLLIQTSTYCTFEEAAEYFSKDDTEHNRSEDEVLMDALNQCNDGKLNGFLLRLFLSEHTDSPRGEQFDWLKTAEGIFEAAKPKATKAATKKPVAVKAPAKKQATRKKAA